MPMFISGGRWHGSFPEAEECAKRDARQHGCETYVSDTGGAVVAHVSPAGHVDLTDHGSRVDCRNPNARALPASPKRRDIGAHLQIDLFAGA